MKHFILAALLAAFSFSASAEGLFNNHEPWAGLSFGYDPKRPFVTTTVTGGFYPKTKDLSWGVQSYLEVGRYDYYDGSGNSITVGIEPLLTWKGLYGGLGLSLGNTTPNLGTIWNFSSVGGYRYEFDSGWSVDAYVRHRSHCEACGIETGKSNTGITTINLQIGLEW